MSRWRRSSRCCETAGRRYIRRGIASASFAASCLRYLSLSAPYLHDGSARTLEDLLENNGDRMGDTRALTAEQRHALAAYLRTL